MAHNIKCQMCNKDKRVYRKNARFCSMGCLRDWLKDNRHPNFKGKSGKRICNNCKKEYWKEKSTKAKRDFCSIKCYIKGNSDKGNPNWKGGKIIQDGYIYVHPAILNESERKIAEKMITIVKRGFVAEHRLRMAIKLNRPLISKEIVHHLNQDRKDNRIENLLLIKHNGAHHSKIDCPKCGFNFGLS